MACFLHTAGRSTEQEKQGSQVTTYSLRPGTVRDTRRCLVTLVCSRVLGSTALHCHCGFFFQSPSVSSLRAMSPCLHLQLALGIGLTVK